MDLTRLTLNNKIVLATLLVLAGAYGGWTYFTLPRAEDPGFNIRTVIITARYPGADVHTMTRQVTDRIEEVLEAIEEVDFMTSQTRPGLTIIELNILEKYGAMRPFWDEVRRKMNDLRPQLPPGVQGPMVNDDFGDVYGTVLALTGDGYERRELEEIAEDIQARLLKLEDVGKVQIMGAPEQRVWLEYDLATLASYGLTPTAVANLVRAHNALEPSGYVVTQRQRIDVEPGAGFTSVEDIEQLLVPLPDGTTVTLDEIVAVRRGYAEPPTRSVTYMGQEALTINVSLHPEGKITRLGPAVVALASDVQADLPVGVELHRVAYQAEVVDDIVGSFVSSLVQGVVLVFLVMLVALGLRTGAFVALVIPMTMVITFIVMDVIGVTLNKTSLAALIMALGLLVDNAIVVSESIIVEMKAGKKPVEAAVESVKELRFPLLVASGTTAAALLPTYLAESAVGEYTSAIFEVVTISVVVSWILAQTTVPTLCVTFLQPTKREHDKSRRAERDESREEREPWPLRQYQRFLQVGLRHRWLSLLVAVLVLAVAFGLARFVPQQFFPRKSEPVFTIALELPKDTGFARTVEVTEALEAYVQANYLAEPQTFVHDYEEEGIINWITVNGSGGPRFLLGYSPEQPRESYAWMLLNTSSYAVQDRLIDELGEFLGTEFPEVNARLEKLRQGPPVEYPVEIRLQGPSTEQLYALADEVERGMLQVPGLININNDWGRQQEVLQLQVDDAALRAAGLTRRDLRQTMQAHLDGVVLDYYREADDLIPMVMRADIASQRGLAPLDEIELRTAEGDSLPLSSVASWEVTYAPPEIIRRDRTPTMTVRGDLHHRLGPDETAFSLTEEVAAWTRAQAEDWPPGYTWEVGGETEASGKARSAIRAKAGIAAAIIILLLVAQFNALRPPLIVLLTLPFGLIGVILGLLITQYAYGFMPLLGTIALFGIMLNNAIVLLDRVELEMAQNGRERKKALLVSARRRFRPILLTVATTAGGLIPLWISGGPMFAPMAVAILFGLIVATALTLGLVPVLYALFYRLKY